MFLYRFKINCNDYYRKYSQAAAAAVASSAATRVRPDGARAANAKNKPSFAKSLYVGNFLTDVFTRNANERRAYAPESDKLCGVAVPEEFGGLGLCSRSASEAYKNLGFADFRRYAAHGSVAKCIAAHGTDEQKRHYLPRLASGERTATFCMYESKHGYDVQNTETTASCADGQWTINGSKHWVTNGKRADTFLVIAKTMDECNRPESNQNFFTAFLVDKENDGVRIAVEGDRCNVTFDNVRAESVLGPENDGLLLYSSLFAGDFLESSSATYGELKKIVGDVCRNARIDDRSGLIKLGRLNSHLYTMDCVLDFTSLILDTYDPASDYEPIIARLFVNETTNRCLSLIDDLGLSKKPYKYVEDSLLLEGRANLLPFIGALLGIQFAGQFMADDVRQLRNPLMFPKYTLTHILKTQRSLKNDPKLQRYIEKYMHPSLKKQALDLEYCLSRFQFGVQNMFINLGPDTCYFQMILERANSVAMDLFAMTAVLHRVSQKLSNSNSQTYPTELIFANVFCDSIREQCSRKVNDILEAPHNVVDPLLKSLGQQCFIEKKYFLEHPLKRNIV